MEFFKNVLGCCCSDNRVDKTGDILTGPQNMYDRSTQGKTR
jgi:hypothetical protein